MEDYVRQRHIEEGFEYVGTPHITKEGLFHTSGHLPYYADTMFPPMEMEGAELLPQGDELPDAQPDLPVARAVLPRAAAAAVRVRVGLPLREVRRGARPDPGPRHDPGRLALLRHPRAGAGRDQAPARLRARPAARLRPRRLLPRAVHPRRDLRTSSSAPTRTGQTATAILEEAAPRLRARARARPGRRGVLRPEDLGAGPRRDRPHLADVDDPVRLQPARPASAWSTRPPTARASSR